MIISKYPPEDTNIDRGDSRGQYWYSMLDINFIFNKRIVNKCFIIFCDFLVTSIVIFRDINKSIRMKILIVRPNKIISVFRVTGLKILGKVGTLILLYFFLGKTIILCILKGILPFKMYKIIYFSRKPKKNPRFHQ